jgi:pyruvyltransferase
MSKQKIILARWYEGYPNWGDILNPRLIKEICGVQPVNMQHTKFSLRKMSQAISRKPLPEYLVIGSTLGWGFRRDHVNVFWGPGFMFENQKIRSYPREVCAVRGPLSRNKLLEQGIECPEVFGDPALLFPRYYNPCVEKKYTLGIVPHMYDESDEWLTKLVDREDVLIINIKGGIEKVVSDIKSCHYIASSSLHGIIAADAYGIPSQWIKLSDKIKGGGFKFRDYFASVGRADTKQVVISPRTTVKELLECFTDYTIKIDLDRLMQACPFKSDYTLEKL